MLINEGVSSSPKTEGPKLRPNRGIISCADLGIYIEFQFNPVELMETKTVDWKTEPIYGLNEPLISFSCGGLRELEFDILLDSHFSEYDVGKMLDDLDDLVTPWNIEKQRTVRFPFFARAKAAGGPIWGMPPVCKLVYGGKVRTVVFKSKTVKEVFHGTTERTANTRKPTRAVVGLRCIVIEHLRSLVDLKSVAEARGVRT